MGRPRAAANDTATIDRVLKAAEEEFGRRGLDRARLEDIARAAGIQRPSLLYHFGSKDGLYSEVVVRAFQGLGLALEEAISAKGSVAERLEATVQRFVDFLETHPGMGAVVLREILDGNGPGRSVLLDQIVPLLDRVEQFVRQEGAEAVDSALPVRAAILQVACGALVRSAAAPLRPLLWGPQDHTLDLARHLFFKGEVR